MARLIVVTGFLCLLLTLVGAALITPSIEAADCDRTSVDLTPITDLTQPYLGYAGGLYLEGTNSAPLEHASLAMEKAAQVQPRLADGTVAPSGSVVLLSLGMTFTTLEYQTFMGMAAGDPQISSDLVLVDGAQDGVFSGEASKPDSRSWGVIDDRLAAAGVTADQVQVVWLKQAVDTPEGAFPEHAEGLRDELEQIVAIAADRFPNLQLLYLSSRVYAGYAETGRFNPQRINPEPYAYESAFSVRWLIEKQISGDPALNPDPLKGPVNAPVLLWGPYLWADGTSGRSDGLVWLCSDFETDGNVPSPAGRQKVANMLMAFFKTHPTAVGWFLSDPEATPNPSATELPTGTPAPTNTPGGGRPTRERPTREPPADTLTPTPGPSPTPQPTRTPAPLKSYRVTEVPSGDQIWISTNNAAVQRLLENLNPRRETWICGIVEVNENLEWSFRFDPASVRVPNNVARQQRSTIREISANTPGNDRTRVCIRVGQVTEQVDGTPPPSGTADPRTPVATTAVPPVTDTPRWPVYYEIMLPILVHQ